MAGDGFTLKRKVTKTRTKRRKVAKATRKSRGKKA